MGDRYYQFEGSSDISDKVEHLQKRSKVLCDAADALDGTGVYQRSALTELAALYASFAGCMQLLAKALPYKKGDRVRLTKAPKCEGGWASSKHFLIVGAVGTIKCVEVDYLMRDWSVYVAFDDESWIPDFDSPNHKKGVPVPARPESRHVYGFRPESVEHLDVSDRAKELEAEIAKMKPLYDAAKAVGLAYAAAEVTRG